MEVLWLVFLLAGASAFNVDVKSCVRHHAPRIGSMFGFAVQEHVENGIRMVLVGAPEDDNRRRPGLYKPGAVYRCSIAVENDCTEVVFDTMSNNNDSKARQIDEKSNQWFGATLVSTGVNGYIVACAPRYVSFVSAALNQREPVGTCFVARNSFKNIEEYSPCRTFNYGYHKQGVCQAGFGAAVSKDGTRLFMGAPGSYYWQGQAYSIDTSLLTGNNFYWPRNEGQLYSQSLSSRPMVVATAESESRTDDSYLGYSVAEGDFNGKGGQAVAVGMPRGADLRGKVVIYTWNLENIKNVSGSQIGAYFGYSLAAGDIDGDTLEDLIVGAPMFTVKNNNGAFEQGRVYVLYQGRGERPFQVNDFLTGEVSRGRFGLSVASLGDMNLDSFGDFAVGAPYGGENGRGVVYVYYGSQQGVHKKYSQAIAAEDIEPRLTTFGFSLSGGIDMDGNQYNDLVVGAYKSDAAVFFKSRPVVNVTADVSLAVDRSKEISLDDKQKTCRLRDGTRVSCIDVEYCLSYDGVNVDDKINFEISLRLDSLRKNDRRLFFINDESNHVLNVTAPIVIRQRWCGSTKVYVVPEVRDKLTPLQVTMEYNLREDVYRSDHIAPVLNLLIGNSASDAVNIDKNCGPDKVCIPDLQMNVESTVAKVLLGTSDNFGINVFIGNTGEDAFEATYHMRIPFGVHFVRTERLETGKQEKPLICQQSAIDSEGFSVLKCDIGNPLHAGQMVKFKVVLQPYDTSSGAPQKFVFSMEANSTNPELESKRYDNVHTLSVGVWVDTNVSIFAISTPPQLHYNASQYELEEGRVVTKDTEFGPIVVHAYGVTNNGPSLIEAAELFIIWPYQTLAGEDLFYLMAQPETYGNIQCGMTDRVNERLLLVERRNTQLYLPQIIRSLEANKEVSFNATQSFSQSSAEASKRTETVQQRRTNELNSASRSQSGASNSRAQGSFAEANRFDQNSRNVHRGGGASSSQGTYVGSRHEAGYDASAGRTSSSQQFGTASRFGESSNQYGASSNQYGASSNQYGSSSNQHGASSNQFGGSQESARGAGRGYNVYRERNTTIDVDERGHVRKTETSTEYGNLGHEGEVGSSWNNRHNDYYGASNHNSQNVNRQSSHSQQDAHNQNWNQASSNQNWNQASSNQNLGWSTEETVNKNLFNAGSRTSVHAYHDSNDVEEVVGGGEEDEIGGLASVAGNADHEFRTVWGAVDNAGSSSGSGSSSSSNYGAEAASGSRTRYSDNSYGSGGVYSGSSSGRVGGAYASGSAQSSQSEHSGVYAAGSARSSQAASARASQSGYSASQGYSGSSHSGSSQFESKHYSSSSGGFEGSSSGSANYQQWGRRVKRQYVDLDKDVAVVLANCTNNFKCAIVRCVTGVLQKNQEVWASLQGRINAKFLNEMTKDRELILTTVGAARVSRLPHLGQPEDASLTTAQAATHITPQVGAPASGAVPLWVVVLAAVAGALLLLLLIFALYKCGFFKRNRPTDQAERQPLNRNGYHGDEHL